MKLHEVKMAGNEKRTEVLSNSSGLLMSRGVSPLTSVNSSPTNHPMSPKKKHEIRNNEKRTDWLATASQSNSSKTSIIICTSKSIQMKLWINNLIMHLSINGAGVDGLGLPVGPVKRTGGECQGERRLPPTSQDLQQNKLKLTSSVNNMYLLDYFIFNVFRLFSSFEVLLPTNGETVSNRCANSGVWVP